MCSSCPGHQGHLCLSKQALSHLPSSQVCHSPGSHLCHPLYLITRPLLLSLSATSGTPSGHLVVLMPLPSTLRHKKFSVAILGPRCLHSPHCHFSSRAFLLGISSYIPESFQDFCQTLHSRSRCWSLLKTPVRSELSLLLLSPFSLLLCPNLWTFLVLGHGSPVQMHQIFSEIYCLCSHCLTRF